MSPKMRGRLRGSDTSKGESQLTFFLSCSIFAHNDGYILLSVNSERDGLFPFKLTKIG